jgi:hypothetical protein
MPLWNGHTAWVIARNIKELRKAGHAQDQAVAIAEAHADKSRKKKARAKAKR